MSNALFWCNQCNIPIFGEKCPLCGEKGTYFAMDARPVFPEEVILLELLLDMKGELRGQAVWNVKGNRFYVNGEYLKDFSVQELVKKDADLLHRQLTEELRNGVDYDYFDEMINKFVQANLEHVKELEFHSMEKIKSANEKYKNRVPMVSFSGGKDSTVVSSLVRRALGKPNILHIFGDTTLEFPMTYDYVNRFQIFNRRTPFIKPKSDHNFLELCDKIGPPSRVMRWCCTVFKTSPIDSIMDKFCGGKGILTFYGVRRSESTRRSKYKEEIRSPKIAKQVVVSPIIDWLDIDVWLYLLYTNEYFNDAYRYGFSRVGCWCCPSNSDWAFFLAKVIFPRQAKEWRDFLVDFAKKIGKLDAEVYVDTGKWKARQGGNGMDVSFSNLTFEPCANEGHARNFNLTRPITRQLYEFFKPFGLLDFENGKRLLGEVFVLDRDTKQILLTLQGREGQNHLKVIAHDHNNYLLLSQRIDCQVRKYQACIGCGGCSSVCKANAVTIIGDKYNIDSKKCYGCKECIAKFDKGCLVTKVTQTGRGA